MKQLATKHIVEGLVNKLNEEHKDTTKFSYKLDNNQYVVSLDIIKPVVFHEFYPKLLDETKLLYSNITLWIED